MNYFTRKDTRLHVENVALDRIADAYGTPCYVYSRAAMEAADEILDIGPMAGVYGGEVVFQGNHADLINQKNS